MELIISVLITLATIYLAITLLPFFIGLVALTVAAPVLLIKKLLGRRP